MAILRPKQIALPDGNVILGDTDGHATYKEGSQEGDILVANPDNGNFPFKIQKLKGDYVLFSPSPYKKLNSSNITNAIKELEDEKLFIYKETLNPTVNDDEDSSTSGNSSDPISFQEGDFWYNTNQKRLFICLDASTGNATWKDILIEPSIGIKENDQQKQKAQILNFENFHKIDVTNEQANIKIKSDFHKVYRLSALTNDNNFTQMLIENSNNKILIENFTSFFFEIFLTARNINQNEVYAEYFKGVIDKEDNDTTIRFLDTITNEIMGYDANWNIKLEANTNDGSLDIKVQGETSKDIRWSALVTGVNVKNNIN